MVLFFWGFLFLSLGVLTPCIVAWSCSAYSTLILSLWWWWWWWRWFVLKVAFDHFKALDERINFVATKVVHLGDQLEGVNTPRNRAVEAQLLMKYFSEFMEDNRTLSHVFTDPFQVCTVLVCQISYINLLCLCRKRLSCLQPLENVPYLSKWQTDTKSLEHILEKTTKTCIWRNELPKQKFSGTMHASTSKQKFTPPPPQ